MEATRNERSTDGAASELTSALSVTKALDMAFALGQQYWQQADSEYKSHWKKADATLAKFHELKARMTDNA